MNSHERVDVTQPQHEPISIRLYQGYLRRENKTQQIIEFIGITVVKESHIET